jgi:aromatic ring-opening dioxygenase catalytic subunit (LigB family)
MDPMPGLPANLWDRMADYLRGIDAHLGARPAAVVVISGHWEVSPPAVASAARPGLLYDYYGFPEHTYRIPYPAPGSPSLARRVREQLTAAGVAAVDDSTRGLDHGVFIPFKLIYPDADVPIVQLSLDGGRRAGDHLAIGRALAPLREEGVLIVGSGMSYHNLRGLFMDRPDLNRPAEAFHAWLRETVESEPPLREARLAEWKYAPGAREAHPTPEHLLPLMVAAGAAPTDAGRRTFEDRLMGKPIAGFQFG